MSSTIRGEEVSGSRLPSVYAVIPGTDLPGSQLPASVSRCGSEEAVEATVVSTSCSGQNCASCSGRFSRLVEYVYPSGFCKELKLMMNLAWPILLTQMCQMIIGPISLIFCGHLGDRIKLDGAALAISMINATCIAVAQGLGTACDTFFSQTFGSQNKKQVGVYVQRAICIFLLALMPCFAIHLNIERFLLLMGQHPLVSRLAGDYMLLFMPGALSFFLYIVLSKYIQNQNIVIPNMVIGLLANGLNALLHYAFLYKLGWGTAGSAMAQSTAYFAMFVLTLAYILASGVYKETWGGWTTECFQEWGLFVRLAVPGMLMLCMEWWAFEIGVFLTGLLGTVELGSQAVLLHLDAIWFQVPLGIQITCSIRVGQYVGAQNPLAAKTAARLAITCVVLLSLVGVSLFLGLKDDLPYLFTSVDEVAHRTGELLPIVTLYIFFDGISTAAKGVLYGTGRQVYGAILLFISYYVMALPAGITVMFRTPLRAAGYWWALAGNLVFQALVLFIIVCRTDWDKEVQKALERAGQMADGISQDSTPDDLLEEKQPLMGSYLQDSNDYRPAETTRRASKASSAASANPKRHLLSTSPTISELREAAPDAATLPRRVVLARRLIAVAIMVSILGAGVTTRLVMGKGPDRYTGTRWNVTDIDLSFPVFGRHNASSIT